MKELIIIDPPSGWKYGFPKPLLKDIYDKISMKDLINWIIVNGYPLEQINSYGDHFYIQITEIPMARNYRDSCISFWEKLNEKTKIDLLQDFGGDPNHLSDDNIIEIISDYWYRESVMKGTDIPNDETFD